MGDVDFLEANDEGEEEEEEEEGVDPKWLMLLIDSRSSWMVSAECTGRRGLLILRLLVLLLRLVLAPVEIEARKDDRQLFLFLLFNASRE